MEVLTNPEFHLPSTYIPLGLSQVTRNSYNGGVHIPCTHAARQIKYTRTERIALSMKRFFFRKKRRSNLEATSDFIFYTTSSKAHPELRRVCANTISSTERREIIYRRSQRRSCLTLADFLRTLLAVVWMLMFTWIVVYSVVRCQQLEGCSFLLTTTEGYVVLAVLLLTFVAGIAVVVILATCKPKDSSREEHRSVSNRVSLETQV
ncbi:hypothetical protein JTE90_020821 [Oedothorax gibbosus]|uniref:Uncharacterized protein n=1 Tax=Oedothorax gibbosus TaxID=931172 RepID=A0AAV6U7K6_9ARAC|nr:hypothetical protein JTE90_020821 [Oedothorax gibbosus]